MYFPSKHEAFTQCCFNVGPPSSTLAQHWNSIKWMPRNCSCYSSDVRIPSTKQVSRFYYMKWNWTPSIAWQTISLFAFQRKRVMTLRLFALKWDITKKMEYNQDKLCWWCMIWTQQTRDIEPLLVQCWFTVHDADPTLNQHWLNVSCLLGRMWCRVLTKYCMA